jgi:hypothetical protein
MAEPTLQWAPQSATVSLPPGGIQDVIVRFASSEQITKIDFTPVPALKGIVSVTPSSVGPIAVGGIEELIIRVSVPVKAKPGTVIDGTIQGRFSNGQKVIAKPLPVVISVSQPQSGVSDAKLYGEPENPLALSYKLNDASFVTFEAAKDANDIPQQLTAMAVLAPGATKDSVVILDESGRPIEIRSANGIVFRFSWSSDTQVLASVVTPDGVAQANYSLDLSSFLASSAESSLIDFSLADHASLAALGLVGRAPALRSASPSPNAKASSFQSTDALPAESTQALAANPVNGVVTVNVNACQQPASDAAVTADIIPAIFGSATYPGVGYRVHPGLTAPGIYQAGFANFPSSIPPSTVLNTCTSIVTPISDFCGNSMLPFDEVMGNGGCVALAQAIAATGVGLVDAPLVLTTCLALVEGTKLACEPLSIDTAPSAICGAITEVVNFVDPDGARIDANVSVPQLGASSQSQSIGGQVTAVSFDFAFDGVTKVQSFTTSPIDPAPFEGYLANAVIDCLAPTSAITLSISGTDGYSDFTSCSPGITKVRYSCPALKQESSTRYR